MIDDVELLLMLGPQKILEICCTPATVGGRMCDILRTRATIHVARFV